GIRDGHVTGVQTCALPIFENSTISSKGDLIASGVDHTDITVRNTKGYGLNPNVYGRAPGRFLDVEVFDNADLENNYMENTAGIRSEERRVGKECRSRG